MKPFFEYIIRLGKSKGFGIQSPWAYSFVRDVIFESLPYYAYANIEKCYTSLREQKREKLFLRLKNYAQQQHLNFKTLNLDSFDAKVLTPDNLLVITDTDKNYNRLEGIKDLPQVGITFDLYSLLICFPPTSERTKQDYKMNF